MVTYTIGFGVIGTIDPNDYDADLKHKTTGDYIVWPDATVGKSTPEKVDDVWHAAVNGRGEFLNSSNPKELVNALNSIMKDIERRVFSASGVAINGDELYQRLEPDLLMFQARYSSEGWTGDIKAFKVDEFSGGVDTLNPEWAAADLLDSKSWNGRIIATHNGTNGIPFRFDSLTDAQKDQLDADWAADDTHARNMMDYLHGDTSEEERNGGTLRSRFSVLGDIVHSAPVFKNDILYAGSNDGMLHAFAATTGEELFAYVPNLVFADLHELADPDYEHQYYVDLAPAIKNVTLSGVSTMLVGGLGKGGRGYFALDLSDLTPANVPATESLLDNRVMWEYPDGTTPSTEVEDLGYSFSKVAVVQSNDSVDAPWIVIFGNGYNSANGHAVLFILDPATGALLKRIDTQVGTCNGLSTPIAVDVDNNNTVDYVYAGDIKGNLWKFDLSADDYNLWDVAYSDAGTPKPLFQTPGQPITTKPSVMFHCEKHGYLVTFGTGRYLGLDDISDTSAQAVYGIWDYGDDDDDSEYVGAFDGSAITHPNLPATVSLLQQIVVDERTENGLDLRTLSDGNPDWATTTEQGGSCGNNSGTEDCDPNTVGTEPDPMKNVGWYFNLPESGERVVSDVRIRANRLTVISYVNEGSTCGLAGHSWVMVMDPCTGGRLSEAHFDTNGDGVIDDQDLINIGTEVDPIWVPPTGIKIDGKVALPSYLIDGNVETGFYNTSDTEIETLLEKAPRLGMTHWRVLRN
jgi:type IV pilus assembly protein PilY1